MRLHKTDSLSGLAGRPGMATATSSVKTRLKVMTALVSLMGMFGTIGVLYIGRDFGFLSSPNYLYGLLALVSPFLGLLFVSAILPCDLKGHWALFILGGTVTILGTIGFCEENLFNDS